MKSQPSFIPAAPRKSAVRTTPETLAAEDLLRQEFETFLAQPFLKQVEAWADETLATVRQKIDEGPLPELQAHVIHAHKKHLEHIHDGKYWHQAFARAIARIRARERADRRRREMLAAAQARLDSGGGAD